MAWVLEYTYTIGRQISITNTGGLAHHQVCDLLTKCADHDENLTQESYDVWLRLVGYEELCPDLLAKARNLTFTSQDVHREVTEVTSW